MKKLIISLSFVILGWVTTASTLAYEGTVSASGSEVACKGSSVWYESRYRVVGRCEGLVYPYETQYEYYSIWAHDVARQTYVRLDDVDRGYFEGDVSVAFDKVIVTAEQDGAVRKPSEKIVASGRVEKFSFDKSQVGVQTTVAENKPGENKTMTVQNTETAKKTTTSSAGSVIGRIITSLLVIILIVVGIVIAGSLLFRNRGSVSA